jgi:hypothetical protein
MQKAELPKEIDISLDVEDVPVLQIGLFRDGTIKRMGTGSEDNSERDLFIGRSTADLFGRLCSLISPDLLRWAGVFADPSPSGKICVLTLRFHWDSGGVSGSQWKYGSTSQGPPHEVRRFVTSTVQITDDWYEKHKQLKGHT